MDALGYVLIALIVGGIAWGGWKAGQSFVWLTERAFRIYEQAALRSLIKRRVRPDYWDMALLSRFYAWWGIAAMIGGAFRVNGGDAYGYGFVLLGFFVWGVASKCWDHACKPRPIDDPHLLMWWECGRLHPPPYLTFG